MGRPRSRATLDGHRGCLRDAPLHTGFCSAARPPAAVSPLVRTRPARGNRARGQYAYCTSRCTRRTRAATPGHGTPHRREEAVTDGSADPSLMRAACTSATARTAHQGRLLPHHGDAAARSGTAHRQAPRTAPSLANAPPLRPSISAPKTHPRAPTVTSVRAPHTHAEEGPCRRRTTVPCPPPTPPSGGTDRQPQRPEGGPPETPRPAHRPVEARAPRPHCAVRRARGPARGGTGSDRPHPVGPASTPSPAPERQAAAGTAVNACAPCRYPPPLAPRLAPPSPPRGAARARPRHPPPERPGRGVRARGSPPRPLALCMYCMLLPRVCPL